MCINFRYRKNIYVYGVTESKLQEILSIKENFDKPWLIVSHEVYMNITYITDNLKVTIELKNVSPEYVYIHFYHLECLEPFIAFDEVISLIHGGLLYAMASNTIPLD